MDDPATELMALLQGERRALLSGDLQALTAMSDRRAALVRAIDRAPPEDPGLLRRLRDSAVRNQALLAGAREGVTAARRLLQEGPGLRTYSAAGTATLLVAPADRPAKRL